MEIRSCGPAESSDPSKSEAAYVGLFRARASGLRSCRSISKSAVTYLTRHPAGHHPDRSASTTRRIAARVPAMTTGQRRPGMPRLTRNRTASIAATANTLSNPASRPRLLGERCGEARAIRVHRQFRREVHTSAMRQIIAFAAASAGLLAVSAGRTPAADLRPACLSSGDASDAVVGRSVVAPSMAIAHARREAPNADVLRAALCREPDALV